MKFRQKLLARGITTLTTRSIQLTKTRSSLEISQISRPNDSNAIGGMRFPALIAGLRPAFSIFTRRIAFPLLVLGATLALIQPREGQSGTWTATGSLITGRFSHSATLLPNGKVLVASGYDGGQSAELYDPANGTWSATGSLITARGDHTATLLPNGKVLVAGGYIQGGPPLSSAELYDPASGTWSATGSLAIARGKHTATLLLNGEVLVAGGSTDIFTSLDSAELYDPASGTWTVTGSLAYPRWYHTATLLPDGKVLVAFGYNGVGDYWYTAELYDPGTGNWTATGSDGSHAIHTATLLPDGRVLAAGGYFNDSSAEIYDPASGTWTFTSNLAFGRSSHTATLLSDGEVLVAGGFGYDGFVYVALARAELYDPASGIWAATGSLITGRGNHTATLLPNGEVLVAGGSDLFLNPFASAELYTSNGGGELVLESSFSRKTDRHNSFDIPLPGIEDRSDGKRFVIGFTFNNNVTGADSATTSCGIIGSVSVDQSDTHTLLVTFNGQTCNQQNVTITAINVHDDQGNTLATAKTTVGLLIGDVKGDSHVGNGDIGNIQGHLGEVTDSTNFRDDINADDRINNQDVQAARAHRGESLP